MADPYIPFGYMPPTLGPAAMPQRPIRTPGQMGFTPPAFPAAEGGLMPQSPQEAADLQQQGQSARNMVTMGVPFALGGPMAMGARGVAAFATRFPRLATGIAGAAGLTASPTAAEPPDALSTARDTIARLRASQAQLEAERTRLGTERLQFDRINSSDKAAVAEAQRRLGLRPDGNWGPDTSKAIAAHKQNVERQIDALGQQATRLGKDLETQEQRLTGLEGGERLRQAEENVSPFSSFLRGYGEIGGTALGLVLGPLARWGMTRHANRVAATRATDVETDLARRMTAVPPRTGRLNEVWREGGAGDRPPFVSAPGTRYGVGVNPNAATTAELFPAPRGIRGQVTGSDAASMGAFGAEAGVAEYRLHGARTELQKALDAATADPSEINISRLQAARDEVAFWQSLGRVGQAGAVGYGTAATKLHREYPRPDLSRADAELANLNRLIAPPKPARKRRK